MIGAGAGLLALLSVGSAPAQSVSDGSPPAADPVARASALIGVFISVTTIPAAADMGLAAAYASWGEARGAAFQLLLNVTLLIVMGAVVLRIQRIIWRARERPGRPSDGPAPG